MRNRFSRLFVRLRGGADPNDVESDDDPDYNEKPIAVPKHKRGREMKSSILSRKAVEAVRQMSLSTKHYDPLNMQSGRASQVEEYHRGYSNDHMYLVPDSTLRTMKNIVNYQLKKPPNTYYVGGRNSDSLPQPTIFDNIKMSLDTVMEKLDGLGDDDESSEITTGSGSGTSDSSAVNIQEPDSANKGKEEQEDVKPENEQPLAKETAEDEKSSKMSDSPEHLSESSDTAEENKPTEQNDTQSVHEPQIPAQMLPARMPLTDNAIAMPKTEQNRSRQPHQKQCFVLEGKFENNFKPVFVIKKCKLSNEIIQNSNTSGVRHKKLVFTKKHSKKVYIDIDGQFVHKETPDKDNENFYEDRNNDTNDMNDCEFAISAQRLCRDNSEITIDITGHLVRQDNSMIYVPVLIIKLKNKSSENNNEPQSQLKKRNAEMPVGNQTMPQLPEQTNSVNKQSNPGEEVTQGLPVSYQTMTVSTNEGSSNVSNQLINHRQEIPFQGRPLMNYQAMPVLINGPGSNINKQHVYPRKETGQGFVNNQIVPALTGERSNKQREKITYRAVNSQVMPVFQMPVFKIPVIECMYLPQNQCYSVIPLQRPIDDARQYLKPQITDTTVNSRLINNTLNTGILDDGIMAQAQNPYSSKVQNNSSTEANSLLYPNGVFPEVRNVEPTIAEKETPLSSSDESVEKNMTPAKKVRKPKQTKKNTYSDKTRPMDTGGGGNKINIVNNPIVGQLEEFFIGHVHIPQTHLHGDNLFEPSYLRQTKFSIDDIHKIKNTAGYLLRSNLQQISESYSGETTTSFEKAILKSQIDIENFFLKADKVESLILLPVVINNCKIQYTEMHLKTRFEESYVKITLQHSIVVVFCNGNLWFIALENTNSGCLQRRKVTLQQYFKRFGIDKSASKLRCVTQKDMSRRRFSDNDLKKLIEKLASCSLSDANTAEIYCNRNLLSITTSNSQLSNTVSYTQNEFLNIYWDVINFLN